MSDDCIVWVGRRKKTGYGVARYQGENTHAHRAAWLEAGREIPPGFVLHHECGNKLCVNLDHLRPMSWGDHSRLHNPAQDFCNKCGGSDWFRERNGQRRCRDCTKEKQLARHHRKHKTDPEYRERARLRSAAWRKAHT